MVTIGRNNIRSRMTPTPQGMARRIDDKLDGVVDAYAARFKTALAVDGIACFIFNKHRGNIPCTCRGFQNLNGVPSHEIGLTGFESQTGDVVLQADGKTRTAQTYATAFGEVTEVSGLAQDTIFDELFRQNNETISQKINGTDPNNESQYDGFTDDPNIDVLDALDDGNGTPMYAGDDPLKQLLSGTDLENSSDLPFSTGMVACPICFGSGTVDSWRLYNGERVVLDGSTRYPMRLFNDATPDGSLQPIVYSIYRGGYAQWDMVALPTSWRHLMRLTVFNRGKEVPAQNYRLSFIHPSNPTVKNPIDYNTLAQLNNSPLLAQGNKLSFVLESTSPDDTPPLTFTHIEIVFSVGELVYMQVPEVDVQNEDEYIDWNLNMTVECAADIELRENSWIIDGKYKRVWKVTSSNRKLTARGKSFGYSVGVRAVHSFERQYLLMNLFKRPIDPFRQNQAPTSDADDY